MSGEALVCRQEPEPVFSLAPSTQNFSSSQPQSFMTSQPQSGMPPAPVVDSDPRARVFRDSPPYLRSSDPLDTIDPRAARRNRAVQRDRKAFETAGRPAPGKKSASEQRRKPAAEGTSNSQTLPGPRNPDTIKEERGKGKGGGDTRGSSRSLPTDGSSADTALTMKLSIPAPRPATGSISARREPLFLAASPKGFTASMSLDAKAAKPTKQSAAEQKAVNPLATDPGLPRTVFAEAAIASRNLYDRIVRAAAEVATQAHAVNDALSSLQQRSLDRQLRKIDDLLSVGIEDANIQRDFALNHVRSRADLLRAKVRSQAAGALGRLSTLATSFAGKLQEPRGSCDDALAALQAASADASAAGMDAHGELQAFLGDRESYLSDVAAFKGESAVIDAAVLEAALFYINPRINADDIDLARRMDAVDGFLKPMLACLPCEIDMKFQALKGHADNLAVAAPKAVRAARNGAIQSIDAAQVQLELAVHDTHRQTQDAATDQHGATRRTLVAQTRSAGTSDRNDIAATAKRQSDMLLGIAAAQPISLDKVHDDLKRGGDLPPAQFAPMVIKASRRFKANVEASAERNPSQVMTSADAQARARRRRVDSADRDRDDIVAQYGRGLSVMVDRNFGSLEVNNETSLLGMDGLPAQVGSTCDGFITAADKAMKDGFDTLKTDAAFLVKRMTDALDGVATPTPAPQGTNTSGDANAVCRPDQNVSIAPWASPTPQMSALTLAPQQRSSPANASTPNSSQMPPQAATAPPAQPAPPAQASQSGAGGKKGGATAPPPASCAPCAAAKGPSAGTGPANASATDPSGGANTTTGQSQTAAPDAAAVAEAAKQRSPRDFRAFADGIAKDVLSAPKIKDYLAQFPEAVLAGRAGYQGLIPRADAAYNAIQTTGETDMGALMGALRGLTKKQGAALSELYAKNHKSITVAEMQDGYEPPRTLSKDISFHAHDSVFTHGSTDNFNSAGALAALNGDVTGKDGSAINELRAAFNFNNSTDRIMTVMQSMADDDRRTFLASNREELEGLIEQLDATEQVRFRAYMFGETTHLRSQQVKEEIDGITRDYWSGGNTTAERNEKRGGRTGEALGSAREGSGAYALTALEGPTDRVDVFGLEDQSIKDKRAQDRWTAIERDFGALPGVVDAITETMPGRANSRAGQSEGSILINYATRPIQMYPWKDGQYGTRSQYAQPQQSGAYQSPYPPSISEVDAYHRLWIENVVDKGRNSREAHAALGLISIRRAGGEPKQDDLEAVFHTGITDAREGAHGQTGAAADAERERGETFILIERYRRRIEGGGREDEDITVADAQAAYRREVAFAFRNKPQEQAMALGIVDHEEGNVQAVIDYAIAHENKDLLTKYMGRLNADQVASTIATWNANHPEGPGLEEKLGINGHHWTTTNWNGAVFTGDEANALEIAFMGVPQNDMERGLVARRVMKQQIDQSGFLGRLLANDEYSKLVANASLLDKQMGITDADIDSRGRIVFNAPGTDIKVRLGFNANGDFVPARGSDINAFESAIALGQITATNYTEAVDRIGTIIATVLIVAAAVITTVLTGGAAASIWIPMLVTAGAGLAGIGIKMALKGGRYGRDEFTQDIVATVVQTLTAGLGAAAGAAARAGPGSRLLAMRSVAGKMRIPFSALDKVISTGGRVATSAETLAVNLGTGAGIGAVSGAVTTALDPAARRSENYGSRIFHSFVRGGAGGFANAGVNHLVSSRLTGAAQRFAGNRAARLALERGASPEAAARYAALSMKAFGQSRFVEIGTRSLASGLAGSSSRGVEMGYENAFADGHHKAGDFGREMRSAFLQNAAQGALEAVGDRSNRRWSASMREEHNYTVRQGADERRHAADAAVAAESKRMGLEPPPAAAPAAADPAQADTQAAIAKGVAEADAIEPPVRHDHANDNDQSRPAVSGARDFAEVSAQAARPQPEPASDPSMHVTYDADGVVTAARRPAPEGERPIGPRSLTEESVLTRGGRPIPDETEVLTARAVGPEDTAERQPLSPEKADAVLKEREERLKTPRSWQDHVDANDGELRPIRAKIDLTKEDLRALNGPMPVGSRIVGTDPQNAATALQTYQILKSRDPAREVLLVQHPGSGAWMVIQGDRRSANKPSGEWQIIRHSHPELFSPDLQARIARSLPSATNGDFDVLRSEVRRLAKTSAGQPVERTSTIDILINGVHSETKFAMRLTPPDDYGLTVTFRHPIDGDTSIGPFKNIAAYEEHAKALTGIDFKTTSGESVKSMLPDEHSSAPTVPREPRGTELTPERRAEAMSIGERMTRAAQAREELAGQRPRGQYDPEIAAAAHSLDAQAGARRLGLVGERDSMIRLHAIINDAAIPPEVRAAVARAALDAARFDMVQAGTLKPGDELMMFFHGAPADQAASYDRVGVDMSRVTGGTDDDAGRGLYSSQDYQSAAGYVEKGGQVFPVLARKSQLGNVIDIRPGTPLHAEWDAFMRASTGHPDARSFGKIVPVSGRPYLADQTFVPFPGLILGPEGAGRGVRYEAFLKSLVDNTNIAPEIRAAAKDPHVTLMDLGGIATWGNDRRMITDQAAIHAQHVADIINEQMGFPKAGQVGTTPATDPGGTVRSVQIAKSPAVASIDQYAPSPELRQIRESLITQLSRGRSDDAITLRGLAQLAPETIAYFVDHVVGVGAGAKPSSAGDDAASAGRIARLSDDHLLALDLELSARSVPIDLRRAARAQFESLAGGQSRFTARLQEAGAAAGFAPKLGQALDEALRWESAGTAAARYAGRKSLPEHAELRAILAANREAAIELIADDGANAARYLRARVEDGTPPAAAVADLRALWSIMKEKTFIETQKDIGTRLGKIGKADERRALIAELVRTRPDALLALAGHSPGQVADAFASMVFDRMFKGSGRRSPTPNQLADMMAKRMRSNILPIIGESATVFSHAEAMGLNILQATAITHRDANRPGLDVVGFSPLAGNEASPGGPVRVVAIDDKSHRLRDPGQHQELQSVSAMTGIRLAENLRASANEISANLRTMQRSGGEITPEMAQYISGANAAIRQMRNAARSIERVPRPPAGSTKDQIVAHYMQPAIAKRIAGILDRQNIVLVVTSERGNINALSSPLRNYGMLLGEEYLRRLWFESAFAQ